MSDEPRRLSLGERITLWREKKGLSQRQLAREAEVSHVLIHKLESGERVNLDMERGKRIARALGCSLDTLAGTFDDPSRSPEMACATVESATPSPVTTP